MLESKAEVPVPLPRGAIAPGSFLVVGAGSIGLRHLRNLRDLGVGRTAVYRTGLGGERFVPEQVAITHDLAAALDSRPAAVLVCNPIALHLPVALEAARRGIALYIEKPLSHNVDGVRELGAELAIRSTVAAVGFQFRFHPALLRVKKWLEAGAIGEVVSARAVWGEYLPDWHPGEDYRTSYAARHELGGGVILTLCHPFDYLRWFLGEVDSVSATAARSGQLELDVEDVAHVTLHFYGGSIATVCLDYTERPHRHTFTLVGREGSIHWSGADGVAHLFRAASGQVTSYRPPNGFTRDSMFREQARNFVASVEGLERPQCGFADGVAALRIALAARRSATEGRRVPCP
jgi:predicted dehydrogenase